MGALSGRSVVITRSAEQNESLRRLLEARGAVVVEVPLVAIAEPEDEGRERDELLQRFHEFNWVVVTSPNGASRVAPFLAAAHAAGDGASFPHLAAVGEATARTLGQPVTLMAEPARAEALARVFPAGTGTVLLVQGDLADSSLEDALAGKGWTVTRVVAYRNLQLRPAREMMLPALAADVLLLASGSAARAWYDAFGTSSPPFVVAMGPSTEKVARNLGLEVSAVAQDQSLEGMLSTTENLLHSQ